MPASSSVFSWAEMKAFAFIGVAVAFPIISKFLLPSVWSCLTCNLLTIVAYVALWIPVLRWVAAGGAFSEPKPNLKGKIVVVTGAAAPGIGFETCIELARMGATVLLGVRGAERAAKVATEVAAAANVPSAQVVGLPLDLSSLKEVKQFADAVLSRLPSGCIDYLINNAGVMLCPYQLTADGLEMQMGTNHFGHFYLTQLLLPALLKARARVVNVSSAAHVLMVNKSQGITYDKMANKATYDSGLAYGQSKLANVYHAMELQRRYGSQGLRAYSLHPGAVSTALQRHVKLLFTLGKPLEMLSFKSPNQGCQTTLFCALSDRAEPGAFHSDCAVWHSPLLESGKAQSWWDFSEEVIRQKTSS